MLSRHSFMADAVRRETVPSASAQAVVQSMRRQRQRNLPIAASSRRDRPTSASHHRRFMLVRVRERVRRSNRPSCIPERGWRNLVRSPRIFVDVALIPLRADREESTTQCNIWIKARRCPTCWIWAHDSSLRSE